MKEHSLADCIPIWDFAGNLAVFWDGSLGAGFRLQGIDISCASANRVNEISRQLKNLLMGVSEGIKLQVCYHMTPNAHHLIDAHGKISKDAGDKHQRLRKSRLEHLRGQVHLVPEIYLFIRSKGQGKKWTPMPKKDFIQKKDHFLREAKSIESALGRIGLSPNPLAKEEWFSLLYDHFNMGRTPPVFSNAHGPYAPSLAARLALTDMESDTRAVKMGNLYLRALSFKVLPEGQTFAAMVEKLLKLPFHYRISQSTQVLGVGELGKLQLSRRMASAMASGAAHVTDLESESKLTALEEVIEEIMDGTEKIVRMDFKVIIWDKGLSALDKKSDEVLKLFREMGQAEAVMETYGNRKAFVTAMPGGCEFFRTKKLKASNCAHLMPVYAPWPGNKDPVCLVNNRNGGLCALNPLRSGPTQL